ECLGLFERVAECLIGIWQAAGFELEQVASRFVRPLVDVELAEELLRPEDRSVGKIREPVCEVAHPVVEAFPTLSPDKDQPRHEGGERRLELVYECVFEEHLLRFL